ncbi:hypothetical protein JXB41_01270 [Candidatus Woesearchaeota archaeon]|nr:hypothetical protein [Candidatus Woesearchaeota archaeon]
MKTKNIFFATIAVFVLIAVSFFLEMKEKFPFLAGLGIIFTILGIILIIKAIKLKNKPAKRFLLLTGIAAAGILPGTILHNLVYALFILLFGEGFWQGGDEPVFFIFALVVCPILFIIGSTGTLVNLKKIK